MNSNGFTQSLRKLMFTILAIAALAGTASVVSVNPVAAPTCGGTHCGSFGW